MKNRQSFIASCCILAACAAAAPAASVNAAEVSDEAEMMLECALALDFAAKKNVNLPVSGGKAIAQFGVLTGNDAALRSQAEKSIDAIWADLKKKSGRRALDEYIVGVAQDCAVQFTELAEAESAKYEGELNAAGTLSANALRAYTNRTGDYAAVADYMVYHYPYGKDLFKDNADGDYLGQIIVEVGASGLRRMSDEAIFAIANKYYWQYNPPATRLVFAEYQRRMRVMRFNEAEAQRWAQRAADDRAAKARSASAGYVGSLGNGTKYRPKQGSGVVVCTQYSGTGGGTVCKED